MLYVALSLFGFFIFASFFLFQKWLRALLLFFSFVPLVLTLLGLKTMIAVMLFFSFFVLTAWLYLLDRKETLAHSRIQSQIESFEKECNELQSFKRVQQQRKEALLKKKEGLTLLREAIRGSGYTLLEEELSQMLLTRALSLIEKGDGGSLCFLKEETKTLLQVAQSTFQKEAPIFQSKDLDLFHQWVLRHRQPLLVENLKKEYRFEVSSSQKEQEKLPQSVISIPLVTEDKILGLLTLYSQSPNTYTVDELRLLSILSGFYALSLSNARLYQKTERLANLDGLTQLVVQRHLKEKLELELFESQRSNRALSLLMLDLDYFKQINDAHGHLAGDAVLIQVAVLLRKFSPQGAIVSRYGGEEFAVLLPGYLKKEAIELAEKLRNKIEEICLEIRRKKIQVTVSIGVASFVEKVESNLLDRADQALYQAKKEGRNRVVAL